MAIGFRSLTNSLVDAEVAEPGALEVVPFSDVGAAVTDFRGGPDLVRLPYQPEVGHRSINQSIDQTSNSSNSQSINQ